MQLTLARDRGHRSVEALPTVTAPVSTTDLTVRLGASTILRRVSLEVRAGEMVALLGANGSGKSTLVRSLVGIVPITSGSARVLGHEVGAGVPWDRVGYVPQRIGTGAGVPATALEVVGAGLLHGHRFRIGRAGRQRALVALEEVGLAHRARESVQLFSGGQQQRVLIARALVRDPDLLVLDEPLAGIDRDSKAALSRTIAGLRERGTTVLVVLHELGELGPLIDRAVVLRHGRVVHDGPPPRPAHGHDEPGHDHAHEHAHGGEAPAHDVPDLTVEL